MKSFYKLILEDERTSFESGILMTPEEATNWLVYSDWLEEHGDDPRRAVLARAMSVLVRYPTQGGLVVVQNALAGKDINPHVEPEEVYNLTIHDRMRIMNEAAKLFPFINQVIRKIPVLNNLIVNIVDEEDLSDILPHGSGIDGRWDIDDNGDEWVAHNAYHCMDDNGIYCGYVHFDVIIPKANLASFEVELNQGDIDAIGERAYLGDLEEDIRSRIQSSFVSFIR